MTIILLILILALAIFIAFHPVCGKIINQSKWPWWRLMYLSFIFGVSAFVLVLKLLGWWEMGYG